MVHHSYRSRVEELVSALAWRREQLRCRLQPSGPTSRRSTNSVHVLSFVDVSAQPWPIVGGGRAGVAAVNRTPLLPNVEGVGVFIIRSDTSLHSRTASEPPEARGNVVQVLRELSRLGSGDAMNILFVMEPTATRAAHALANYMRVGEELGRTMALYGMPDPGMSGMRFSGARAFTASSTCSGQALPRQSPAGSSVLAAVRGSTDTSRR